MKKKVDKELQEEIQARMKEIGKKVRMERKKVNNNYEDFAKDHNLNKVTLARIENGENFTLSSLMEVLKPLNISLKSFFKDF